MSYKDRRTLEGILRLNPRLPKDWEVIKTEYRAVDIDKVIIDGDTFTNYGVFQFAWVKSFLKEPERSQRGSIDNMNSYPSVVTSHLIINFSIMSIDDYRAITRKDLEKNEFIVECYDPIYNQTVIEKMYFHPLEMAKLYTIEQSRFNGEKWEDFIMLAGVQDYTVEMVGTNADYDKVSVRYIVNPPIENGIQIQPDYAVDIGEPDIYKGEDILIGSSAQDIVEETFSGRYKFSKWNISSENPTTPKEKGNYINGTAYTINNNLVLYAQWVPMQNKTLNFAYGVSEPILNEETYNYTMSVQVVNGQPIGILPRPNSPVVEYNGTQYTPYTNGAWYKTAQKTSTSVAVQDNEIYWSNYDSTIYYLYDIKKSKVTYYIDGKLFMVEPSVEYNTNIPLPNITKVGYVFDGWYASADYKGEKISGKMPPTDIKLYGKWVLE